MENTLTYFEKTLRIFLYDVQNDRDKTFSISSAPSTVGTLF